MRKKYLILPIILSLFSILIAGAPDTLWTRTYGHGNDFRSESVQQTHDGGFIVAGAIRTPGLAYFDVFLMRINSSGDSLWTKTYGDTGGEWGYSAQLTRDSGIIVTGHSSSFGNGKSDVYLIKTDLNGDTLWTRTYGGESYDIGYSVKETKDKGFIITGESYSLDQSYKDVYLIRTNSNGDTLWTKKYGGENWNECGYSVIQTSDEGFIIAGTKNIYQNYCKVFLIRTDLNGDTLWTKEYGGNSITSHSIGYSIQKTHDSNFIIAGFINPYDTAGHDAYLIHTDSNGDTSWTKTYNKPGYDKCYSVQQTSDGGYIITGESTSFITGSLDVYVIRTNSRGDTLWTKEYGGIGSEKGKSIQQTSDGGFIIAGLKAHPDTTSFYYVYLIRLDKDSTAIQQEIPFNFHIRNNYIVTYDHGNISIRYTIPYSSPVKLEAYNIKGKLVKVIANKFMQKGSYCVNLDSKRFGSGVYYIKLSMENNKAVKKFIVAK